MKFRLLVVGKAPAWVNDGVGEYAKRIPRFAVEQLSNHPQNTRMHRLIDSCGDRALRVLLDKSGRMYTSLELARQVSAWQMHGRDVCFVIGDDVGFREEHLAQADMVWSLSPMTLPHQLTRIVVVEQLYRAHSINTGHAYHRT